MRALVFIFLLLQMSAVYGYQIEKITDKLYRFVDDRHRSVFLVTREGILVVDSLNPRAATHLKSALQKQFALPVRYLVYSHNHSDHIYGAAELVSPSTQIIAHSLAAQDIALTGANTLYPHLRFNDSLSISLGDEDIVLRYHGPNDGRGSISVQFVQQNSLFVVDWVLLGRMPWQKLWSYDIAGVINATREVMSLEFEHFIGGHADVGTKSDVGDYLRYMESLYGAVIKGIHQGKSLEQLKRDIRLDEFKHLRHYEQWLPLNVEGVYERLMEESGMGWRPDID